MTNKLNKASSGKISGALLFWLMIIGLVVIFAVVTFFRMRPPEGRMDPSKMPKPVDVQTIEPETIDIVYTTRGTLEAHRRIDMNTEAAGTVQRILFNEGDTVRKGQLLIQMKAQRQVAQMQEAVAATSANKTLLDLRQNEIAQAKAQLGAEEANLNLAQSEYNKYLELSNEDYISQLELDQKFAALQTQKSQLTTAVEEVNRLQSVKAQTKAQLQESKARQALNQVILGEMNITAPFSGRIGEKYVDEGDYVLNTEKLLTLVDNTQMQVRFTVPERYSPYLTTGKMVKLFSNDGLSSQNSLASGRVSFVDPAVELDTRTIAIKALLHANNTPLRDGQFADVVLTLYQEVNGISLPESALVPEGEKFFVYVQSSEKVTEDEKQKTVLKARRREVKIGQRRNGTVQIIDGLDLDETVVVSGTQKVFDGAFLQPNRTGLNAGSNETEDAETEPVESVATEG